jgi:hypothetical protein
MLEPGTNLTAGLAMVLGDMTSEMVVAVIVDMPLPCRDATQSEQAVSSLPRIGHGSDDTVMLSDSTQISSSRMRAEQERY